jgi:GDP-L-fucose synthase
MTKSNPSILPNDARIYVAGHRGMVGSALMRLLRTKNYTNIITKARDDLDLINQPAVNDFFKAQKIDAVFLAAAKVGGIHANNTFRADFIYENVMVECNVIHAACRAGVEHLLFLGSSCIYPRNCPQPIIEEYLLSGYLEPTNEPYAVAKIAGIKLCESYNRQYGTRYRAVMPTNLYGPNDNFDLKSSHVLPAMIRKFHLAKLALNHDWSGINKDEKTFGKIPEDILRALKGKMERSTRPAVKLWGTGSPKREFLHVDDMAAACLHLMQMPENQYDALLRFQPHERSDSLPSSVSQISVSHLNIGSGKDNTIKGLAKIIEHTVGYEGGITWDTTMPDGMPQKLLDVSRLNASGWLPKIDLKQGIKTTYQWYREQLEKTGDLFGYRSSINR